MLGAEEMQQWLLGASRIVIVVKNSKIKDMARYKLRQNIAIIGVASVISSRKRAKIVLAQNLPPHLIGILL